MNAYQLTALGAGPFFFFVSQKNSNAEFFHLFEIVDHAHAVLGPIARIQVIQPVAGKSVTAEAVPDFALYYLLTVLDPANDAGFRLDAVVAPAAGTGILFSCIRDTEATIHPAGGDQARSNRVCL